MTNREVSKVFKKSVLILMWVVAVCNVHAQKETYKSGSLLWKISGKDLSEPSYLLGTFHLKPGEYLDSIQGARAALQSCKQLVVEVDMADMAGIALQLQQAMMMSSDTTYKMLYSKKDYKFADKQLTSLMGVGLEKLGILKPAAIQLTAVQLIYAKHFPNVNPANVLDIYIQSEAVREQKPVLALETANDQIHILFGIMSLQRQAESLLCQLKNTNKITASVAELVDDYRKGNLNKLYQQLRSDICPSTPSEIDALNKNRNFAWINKLPDMMKSGSSFIAVGALHLAGEEGLLNLLEKLGYTVEPIGL